MSSRAAAIAWSLGAALGVCTGAPNHAPAPAAREPGPSASAQVRPSRAAQLVAIIESFQPRDPAGPPPNRWTEIVRAAFMYSGALHMFASQSESLSSAMDALNAGVEPHHRVPAVEFMLLALDELPSPGSLPRPTPPGVFEAEARKFLDALEQDNLLLHLHQLAGPCRLVAPAPFEGVNAALIFQDTFEQGAIKNLASACCAAMRLAAKDGDRDRFLRSFRSGMRLGYAACGRPMLVSLMNAHAIQNRVMLHAFRAVRDGQVEPDACRELLDAVGELRLPGPAPFVEIERLIGEDAIDRFFDRRAVEQAAAGEDEVVSVSDLTRAEAHAAFNEAMDQALRVLDEQVPATGERGLLPVSYDSDTPGEAAPPPPPTTTPPPGPATFVLRLPQGRTDPDGLLRSLLPPIDHLCMSEQEHRCVLAGLTTAVLVEAHRRRTGALPANLEELSPDDLHQVGGTTLPADPFDQSRPLGYRRAGDRTYTLYSVGADRADDGGAGPSSPPGITPRRRDALIPQARFRGTDYVIFP